MIEFTKTLAKIDSRLVALNEKTVKGFMTEDGFALHILTEFCVSYKMSLGEETVAGNENEIVAIPRLLNLICVKNCIITIDVMDCQTAIAEKKRCWIKKKLIQNQKIENARKPLVMMPTEN